MNLYALRIVAPGHYAMAKFDGDFNFEIEYNLMPRGSGYQCDCPAGARTVKLKPCKHQRMLPFMTGAANTDRFYDPDTRTWHQPLPKHILENADLPHGVTALSLDNSATLHNTIAEAVGEPPTAQAPMRRRV